MLILSVRWLCVYCFRDAIDDMFEMNLESAQIQIKLK